METHIHNVVNLTKWQDLLDVVLVGHSYGGSTATCHATPECTGKKWRTMEIAGGHIVMLDAPAHLSEMLMQLG